MDFCRDLHQPGMYLPQRFTIVCCRFSGFIAGTFRPRLFSCITRHVLHLPSSTYSCNGTRSRTFLTELLFRRDFRALVSEEEGEAGFVLPMSLTLAITPLPASGSSGNRPFLFERLNPARTAPACCVFQLRQARRHERAASSAFACSLSPPLAFFWRDESCVRRGHQRGVHYFNIISRVCRVNMMMSVIFKAGRTT